MYLKQKRIIDKKYLQSARDKACLCCGSRGDVCMHHLRSSSQAGTGLKAPDSHVIPLCAKHHTLIHKNEKAFLNKYKWVFGDNAIAFAELLYKRYKDTCN